MKQELLEKIRKFWSEYTNDEVVDPLLVIASEIIFDLHSEVDTLTRIVEIQKNTKY